MRAVSDRFLTTLRGSHQMSARARVVQTFQTGTDPDGTEISVLDGDTLHDTSAERASLRLVTEGRRMFPRRGNLLLYPAGNEIFVERAVQFGGGTSEWVSLGYYRIEEPDQGEAPDGPIRILGKDRMVGIIRGRLLAPVPFAAGDTYNDVIEQLVLDVYPSATIEWDSGASTQLGRDLIAETDRYKFLNDLITGLGKIWYWDHRGVLVIRNLPSNDSPVWDVDGGEGGVLLQMRRTLSREGVYNGIVATGEGADTAESIRAVAVDANPASPTYWGGPFGKEPNFITHPSITDPAQAQTAAEAELRKQLGLRYSADFTAVPNPALEPWDPVRVRHRDGNETHILDQVRIPLTSQQPMTAQTREQTVVIVGAL